MWGRGVMRGGVGRWLGGVRRGLCGRRSDAPVAIVTGSSQGIGGAIAEALRREGYKTYGFDVAPLEQRTQQEDELIVDVAEFDHVRAAVDIIVARHGRIDVLVNNAAVQPAQAGVALHEIPEVWWNRTLAVNINGVYNTARAVVPVMIEQHNRAQVVADPAPINSVHDSMPIPTTGGGAIVNIASVQGIMSQPAVGAYSATKGAILSLTRTMACDYGRYGIRVNAVNPGTVDTPLVRHNVERAGATMEQAGAIYPLESRVGQPSEAQLAAYVARWQALNPDFDYVLYDDADVDAFIQTRFPRYAPLLTSLQPLLLIIARMLERMAQPRARYSDVHIFSSTGPDYLTHLYVGSAHLQQNITVLYPDPYAKFQFGNIARHHMHGSWRG
ncbi:uncharacterized protein MONBRDRAFT_10960 [Monosiga brevicollis MX1]|uniref:Uncharacterized protein n=1 Tax=Monosiga brevicollis TaxID=81824 RepID=A9V7S3_MONBE|nr:uncharacterized protein MONBRDRAFT_10960 [Monosiga brevicollis MX1]EDQ86356.1 predicted protein [Monosiga brevicollis MX1]|eukprot:XP_001748746.1 hypothetical protein [Monosiga brevicollis MX1]